MKLKISAVFLAITTVMTLFPAQAAAYYYRRPSYSIAGTRTSTATTAQSLNAGTADPVASTLLTLLNQERSKYGLPRLQLDTTLSDLARTKSQDMVANRYFSHVSPTLGSPAQMLARNGVRYTQFAENIAQGSDASRIHAMWMNSAGHRANILNPAFTHVGIGTATGSSGSTATQLFVSR